MRTVATSLTPLFRQFYEQNEIESLEVNCWWTKIISHLAKFHLLKEDSFATQ